MPSMLRKLRRAALPSWTDKWAEALPTLANQRVLHIGCGADRFGDGFVRLDLSSSVGADVVWDLNETPYPFEDNSFDAIIAFNIIEHLPNFFDTFRELHRILKPNGRVFVIVPHFSSAAAFTDPTHVKCLSANSMDYFIDGTLLERSYSFYVDYRFELRRRMISLNSILRLVPGLTSLISARPGWWEDHLCYVVRGRGIYSSWRSPGHNAPRHDTPVC